jgi:hypothetical protein
MASQENERIWVAQLTLGAFKIELIRAHSCAARLSSYAPPASATAAR